MHIPGFRLCFAIQSEVLEAAQLQEVLYHVQGPGHLAEQQHPVSCIAKHLLVNHLLAYSGCKYASHSQEPMPPHGILP